jgi:hypothetical protein
VEKGRHYTIAYPSTAEAQRMIEEAVLAEYTKVTGETVSGLDRRDLPQGSQ